MSTYDWEVDKALESGASTGVLLAEGANRKAQLRRASIINYPAHIIVVPCNHLIHNGASINRAVQSVAGNELRTAVQARFHMGSPAGDARMTPAYNIKTCGAVIHAVGPDYRSRSDTEAMADELESCYRKSMHLAKNISAKSVAFSSINTGMFDYPPDEAAEIATRTVKQFWNDEPGSVEEVVFIVDNELDEAAYRVSFPITFTDATLTNDNKTAGEPERWKKGPPLWLGGFSSRQESSDIRTSDTDGHGGKKSR